MISYTVPPAFTTTHQQPTKQTNRAKIKHFQLLLKKIEK
jgi:hypothetical protein